MIRRERFRVDPGPLVWLGSARGMASCIALDAVVPRARGLALRVVGVPGEDVCWWLRRPCCGRHLFNLRGGLRWCDVRGS